MASGSLIDVHRHWLPAEHFDDVERWLTRGEWVHRYDDGALEIHRGNICVFPRRTAILSREDDQLQAMDALGVQSAVLSVGNWLEWLDLEGCRTVNDGLARVVQRYPDRFVGLAHVPALAPGALDELTRCMEELGFPGVMVICHFVREALPLDASAVRPFWQKVEALNARVVIHPATLPLEYFAGLPPERAMLVEHNLDKSVGRAHSVTVAVMRLLLGNLMDDSFRGCSSWSRTSAAGCFAMGSACWARPCRTARATARRTGRPSCGAPSGSLRHRAAAVVGGLAAPRRRTAWRRARTVRQRLSDPG